MSRHEAARKVLGLRIKKLTAQLDYAVGQTTRLKDMIAWDKEHGMKTTPRFHKDLEQLEPTIEPLKAEIASLQHSADFLEADEKANDK